MGNFNLQTENTHGEGRYVQQVKSSCLLSSALFSLTQSQKYVTLSENQTTNHSLQI